MADRPDRRATLVDDLRLPPCLAARDTSSSPPPPSLLVLASAKSETRLRHLYRPRRKSITKNSKARLTSLPVGNRTRLCRSRTFACRSRPLRFSAASRQALGCQGLRTQSSWPNGGTKNDATTEVRAALRRGRGPGGVQVHRPSCSGGTDGRRGADRRRAQAPRAVHGKLARTIGGRPKGSKRVQIKRQI